MCGIYYVEPSIEEEIERFIIKYDAGKRPGVTPVSFTERDIRPTDLAPVIGSFHGNLIIRDIKWGLSGYQKGHVVFNARSETALDKSFFRGGIEHGRIVIPASKFYEWNKRKEKSTFGRMDGAILFMAGFSVGAGAEERFTILTTAANASMMPVHDRMPLILEEKEVLPWLFDRSRTEELLGKIPCQLERKTDYEQMSMF